MKRKYLWLIGGTSVLLVVVAAFLLFPVMGAKNANDKVYVAAEDAGISSDGSMYVLRLDEPGGLGALNYVAEIVRAVPAEMK
jgi:hypothetical protein